MADRFFQDPSGAEGPLQMPVRREARRRVTEGTVLAPRMGHQLHESPMRRAPYLPIGFAQGLWMLATS